MILRIIGKDIYIRDMYTTFKDMSENTNRKQPYQTIH